MKRNEFMMIRATEEEKEEANKKAKEMDMGLSSFIRFLIRQWGSPQTYHNQRESLWERILEFLYALYLKIRH